MGKEESWETICKTLDVSLEDTLQKWNEKPVDTTDWLFIAKEALLEKIDTVSKDIQADPLTKKTIVEIWAEGRKYLSEHSEDSFPEEIKNTVKSTAQGHQFLKYAVLIGNIQGSFGEVFRKLLPQLRNRVVENKKSFLDEKEVDGFINAFKKIGVVIEEFERERNIIREARKLLEEQKQGEAIPATKQAEQPKEALEEKMVETNEDENLVERFQR